MKSFCLPKQQRRSQLFHRLSKYLANKLLRSKNFFIIKMNIKDKFYFLYYKFICAMIHHKTYKFIHKSICLFNFSDFKTPEDYKNILKRPISSYPMIFLYSVILSYNALQLLIQVQKV